MAFDRKDWEERMSRAKTGDELAALMMELPERSLDEMSEEDREFIITEQKIDSELSTLGILTKKTKDG